MSGPVPTSGVASPCSLVCRIDPLTGWCEGCRRSLQEIAAWSTMDDAGKTAVWAKLAVRSTTTTPLPPLPCGDRSPGTSGG